MSPVGVESNSCMCVPDLHGLIITARCDVFATGRPGESADFIGVSRVGEKKPTRKGLPDADGFISTCCGDFGSIRGPGDGLNNASSKFVLRHKSVACEWIPNFHGVVPISGGDELAIGRPGDGVDKFGVTLVDAQSLTGASVPDLDGVVPTAGGDVLA